MSATTFSAPPQAPPQAPAAATTACAHCGQPAALSPGAGRFCCPGCEAAFTTIDGLGLGRYYAERVLDPAGRAPRPDHAERWDLARHITTNAVGEHELALAVDGLQCGACVWLIESVLAREPGLHTGRVNMTTSRLRLVWTGDIARGEYLVAAVERLGYRLIPYNATALAAAEDRTGRQLIRALAVAGFAASNVMISSIAVWAGLVQDMGPATRGLLHWVSALIAMPAIAYAGQPFFRSAYAALRHGRTNMDVPISIGVVLVTAMSLVETIEGREHAFFDSAVSLIFFLLIGRVLDHFARGRARAAAEQLVTLRLQDVAVLQPDGTLARLPPEAVAPGAHIVVGPGERIGVDGVVARGSSPIDTSLVTGESLPANAGPGARVFAGTINLGASLTIAATATGEATLLAECVRLIEAAEARRGRFVVLADRVARRYAPTVHIAAAATFLGWWGLGGVGVGEALLIACAVLIITCPCALALAVPAVQVIATSRLFRHGMLLKSATALERLAEADTVVFDKTGTLTMPMLALEPGADPEALAAAAPLAAASCHPLARSLAAAVGPACAADSVIEHPGAGLEAAGTRLGSRDFAGDQSATPATGPELWLSRPGHPPAAFRFAETLRPDAATTIARLRAMGLTIRLASGDRDAAVARIAAALAIQDAAAELKPADKIALIETLQTAGHHVLMVGDGLNDGPALAAAHVSASPASAADISQTTADVVFQGDSLAPIADLIATARRAGAVMRQNIGFSIAYNTVMLPLAVAGYVTPWLAAAAMSSSSLIVMANSFRLNGSPR